MAMLFQVDTLFGHVIEDTPEGPVYQDDRTPVCAASVRPCLGCGVKIAKGSHDPCIANLAETLHACCGHGNDLHGKLSGYVALRDGRHIQFSGILGGPAIRAAVDAALKGEPLPEGFLLSQEKMWWAGLTSLQRSYVEQNQLRELARLVQEVQHAASPSEAIVRGEKMWYEECNEDEKKCVLSQMPAMLAKLVLEAQERIASHEQYDHNDNH